MAPLVIVPHPAEKVEVSQLSQDLLFSWTNPTTYTDGNPLSTIGEIEVWLAEGKRGVSPRLTLEDFQQRAGRVATIKREMFLDYQKKEGKGSPIFEYLFKLTKDSFFSSRLYFALRVKDRRGRASEFSALCSFEPEVVPLPPEDVQYTFCEDRVEIRWTEPLKNIDNSSPPSVKGYNLYRIEEGGLFLRLNPALLKETFYIDRDFSFGHVYHYVVRASSTESSPFAESSDSLMVEVEARDIFAPAPPSGLVSIAGDNFITLSWDENEEEDLLGYRVWRREEGDDEFVMLTPEPFLANAYVDSTVEKKKRYYYAITALDQRGNESERSELTSSVIKEFC